MSYQVQQRWAK